MAVSDPAPDERGALSSRERAILADIAADLSADRELVGWMARPAGRPVGWLWAVRCVVLVVLLAGIAGAVSIFPGMPDIGIGGLTVGTIGPWLAWCAVGPVRRGRS